MKILSSKPLKSDILVFDEINYEYLKKVLPSGYSITIIKQRPEEIFISREILKGLVHIFIKRFSIKEGIKKSLKRSYYESLILSFEPKAVLTIIDNHPIFNYLSKTIKSIPFIAIQNGLRHPFEGSSGTFHVQHYYKIFTFRQSNRRSNGIFEHF